MEYLLANRHRLTRPPHRQKGVVLIIAMIMLIVVSVLAVTSMRNAASTEALAGNVRTTELATQAADIALRHCESSVIEINSVAGGATPSYSTTITAANFLAGATPPNWQNTATWDSVSSNVLVLPMDLVGDNGTYKRPPECMIENIPIIPAGSSTVNTTATYVITARGFGPEVAAADAARSRPTGSEVWLQSHLELQ